MSWLCRRGRHHWYRYRATYGYGYTCRRCGEQVKG